jgi:putative DNA primase/helicase
MAARVLHPLDGAEALALSFTDANDLHVNFGLDVLRGQLLAAMAADLVLPDDSPRPSADSAPAGNSQPGTGQANSSRSSEGELARFSLAELLQRFSLAMPDGKIWDSRDARLIKKGAARDWWGEKLFKEWQNHDSRATVMQDDVQAFAAAAQLRGRGGLADALNRYIYIYPTDSSWDVTERRRVPVSALKLAIADVFDGWLKHPSRRDIDERALVFDPGGPLEQAGRINTFRGLPFEGVDDAPDWQRCVQIRTLMYHLTNGDEAVYWWMVRWLAYPLQHVGAKMASALLLHSDVQGSGKSLLFEDVIKPMYGEYGATLGQHQLESQYTDWRSQVLFALFEEIFSGATKFAHTGQMKQMITGKTQRIEKKYMAGWEEANHMNAVFLSNETQPFPLDPSDRRMLVLWPRKKLTDELKAAVLAEIADGGVAVFLAYLRWLDLGDFHTHTEPPITDAKQDLIDYSRYGWDLFHRDWSSGATEWPYQTCLLSDLYQCYKRWCSATGERDLSLNKFGSNIGKRERKRSDLDYDAGYSSVKKGVFIIVGDPPAGVSQKKWLGECVAEFKKYTKPDHDPA